MTNFQYWDTQFKQGNMSVFNRDEKGLFWLKLKSIMRRGLLERFSVCPNVVLPITNLDKAFVELFNDLSKNIEQANRNLDAFIRKVNAEQIASRRLEGLVSELYKLRNFDWGGDYRNALDKYIISRYVKIDDPSYEKLLSKFDTEINQTVQRYVLNSWFNYWSSVLIENIFISHPVVLPAIGKVKSVDFFIHGIPFDLKVTYFPSEFLAEERKENGYPVELTYLKQQAKATGISFDKKAAPDVIEHEIREKMKDRGDAVCTEILRTIKNQNLSILERTRKRPDKLSRWLYEHQGEMRFGSENRIYLILIDVADFSNSWKLKRNLDLLRPKILGYLDSFSADAIHKKLIDFRFKGKPGKFSALADTIFIVTGQT